MNKSFKLVVAIGLFLSVVSSVHAAESSEAITKHEAIQAEHDEEQNGLDELNPFDPNIEDKLIQMDEEYYQQTGQLPYLQGIGLMIWAVCLCNHKLRFKSNVCKKRISHLTLSVMRFLTTHRSYWNHPILT